MDFQMHITVTIRLYTDFHPVLKFEMRNIAPTRHITVKFVFIFHEENVITSFEKTWSFQLPRRIDNIMNLLLLGVTYTAAIFDGIMRGLEIDVVQPESPRTEIDHDVTAEWPREG
jgi:hypothetical protein